MKKYLDYLKMHNITYNREDNLIITSDESKDCKNLSVIDIFSKKSVTTMVIGYLNNVSNHKKLDLIYFLNKKNLEESLVKISYSNDLGIVFSISDMKLSKDEILSQDLFKNRKLIKKYVEEYNLLDYLKEKYSRNMNVNDLIKKTDNSSKQFEEKFIKILKKEEYFYSSQRIKLEQKVSFGIVKKDESTIGVDVIFRNNNSHEILYKNIFSEIPEKTELSILEFIAILNDKIKDIRFIYDFESKNVNAKISYKTDLESFSEEELFTTILDISDIIYYEKKNYIKYIISSRDELLIEVPEEK